MSTRLLALALLALAAHALRLPPCAPAHRAPLAKFARRARTPVCDEYTLKQQMEAYVKMLRETGRELTPEQEEMLAEIEAEDDSVLEQTGTKFEWSGGASGAPAAAVPPPRAAAAARAAGRAGVQARLGRLRAQGRGRAAAVRDRPVDRAPGGRRRPVERRRRAPARRPAPLDGRRGEDRGAQPPARRRHLREPEPPCRARRAACRSR